MAGVFPTGAASSNSVGSGYWGGGQAVQPQSQPYYSNYPNMGVQAPPENRVLDLYENSGTQYINGLTNQIGIVKGHGNGTTVYGSFYVR